MFKHFKIQLNSDAHLIRGCVLAIGFFLGACEPQTQKNNFRTVTADAPVASPTASASKDSGAGSPSPSQDSLNSGSPSPSSSLTTGPTPSPSSSQPPSSSPSTSATPSPSSTASAGNDIQSPTPGSAGEIDISNITSSALDLSWTIASDNKTNAHQLTYLVYMSASNNLTTVAEIEANGTAIGSYAPDLSGKSIFDLTSATFYYFNVIVKDAAGNKAAYTSATAATTDITPPAVGNATITASAITATSMTLSWTAAADTITASANLQYLVYRSTANNLTIVSDIENNGIPIGSFSPDLTTKAVTGLISSRTYYFNIIVKDSAGNKAVYTTASASTLDVTAPLVGGSGVIAASSISDTALTLSWTKATDNVSAQAGLQYLVYQSTSSNLPSLSGAESNGTALGSYASDINSKVVTGLSANTTYYFTVVARDAAGNKVAYSMMSASTIPLGPSLSGPVDVYAAAGNWTYSLTLNDGLSPFVYSLSSAPAGATINSSTGVISYTVASPYTDKSFSVQITDAAGRSASFSFTLHSTLFGTCVWTGAVDSVFLKANNWTFCDGNIPGTYQYIIIDSTAPHQPTLSASKVVIGFNPVPAGRGGGTLTIEPGVTLSVDNGGGTPSFMSDLTLQGSTPTCTTCRVAHTYLGNYFGITVSSGATLRIGSGMTVGYSITAGHSSQGPGHLIIDTGSSNPAEWPRIDCDFAGGNGVCGGVTAASPDAQNPSTILIDGLNIIGSHSASNGINTVNNVTVKKLRNINFSLTGTNLQEFNYIDLSSCTGLSIEDTTWSGLAFSQGMRSWPNPSPVVVPALRIPACTGIGPINISGTGFGYALESDPNNLVNWSNSTGSTCTWTGAVDTAWNTPGNWSNCTNGRNNYPDQLDSVVIPVTANQPVITGNYAMMGTASGTGGGTITVNANSSLYVNETATDTFASSIKFAGGSAGCTTCVVQMRGQVTLGDGVSFTLLPDIHILMTPNSAIVIGESSGRSNRAANFITLGGATAANYPVITVDPNLSHTAGWKGIIFDGKTGTNSTASINGLVMTNLESYSSSGSGLILSDRFTISKLDHLSASSATIDSACGAIIHIANCSNSSLVTTWDDLTIVNSSTPGYSVFVSDSSCSAIGGITINGQGTGYGSSFANDPNGRLTWQ